METISQATILLIKKVKTKNQIMKLNNEHLLYYVASIVNQNKKFAMSIYFFKFDVLGLMHFNSF